MNEVKENQNATKVNGEAVKAKANEVVEKVKKGAIYYKDNIKTDKKLMGITAIVAAVVVLLVLVLAFGKYLSPSYRVVKTYADAMVDYDAKEMVKIYHEDMIEYYEDYLDDDYEDFLEESFDDLEDYGTSYKEYEIDMDYKKYDKDDVEDYAEDLEDIYDIDEKLVKAVRRYTVKFKVKEDGKYTTEKVKVIVAKIGSKWYYVGTE